MCVYQEGKLAFSFKLHCLAHVVQRGASTTSLSLKMSRRLLFSAAREEAARHLIPTVSYRKGIQTCLCCIMWSPAVHHVLYSSTGSTFSSQLPAIQCRWKVEGAWKCLGWGDRLLPVLCNLLESVTGVQKTMSPGSRAPQVINVLEHRCIPICERDMSHQTLSLFQIILSCIGIYLGRNCGCRPRRNDRTRLL